MNGYDVTRSGMTWAVRQSFVQYVTHAHGDIEVFAPATADAAGFTWPASEVITADSGERSIVLGGGVLFTAHGGLLHVPLHGLVLHESAGSYALAMRTAGSSERVVVEGSLRSVATQDGSEAHIVDDPALHADAVDLFGGNYAAGTVFSPFVVILARSTADRSA